MSDDLISRQELLESIEKVSVKGNVLDDDWVYRFVQEFPSIDAVPVKDGTLKARSGNYVTYRIDWLLDNLAQEISLLEGYRRGRKEDG